MCDIQITIKLTYVVPAMWVLFKFALDTVLPLPFADFLTDHQGSSQSDHRTNTGFGSFKLPTCEWLQKGRSHSQMESSLV